MCLKNKRIKWTKQNPWCPVPGSLMVLKHPEERGKFTPGICFPDEGYNKNWVTPKELYRRTPVLCIGMSNAYCVKILINSIIYLIFLDDIDYMI